MRSVTGTRRFLKWVGNGLLVVMLFHNSRRVRPRRVAWGPTPFAASPLTPRRRRINHLVVAAAPGAPGEGDVRKRGGKIGRPSKYTPELAALICNRIPIPVQAADSSSRFPLSLFSATKARPVSINILTVIQPSSRLLHWRTQRGLSCFPSNGKR
jgi:hypothetical protein